METQALYFLESLAAYKNPCVISHLSDARLLGHVRFGTILELCAVLSHALDSFPQTGIGRVHIYFRVSRACMPEESRKQVT